MGEPGDREASDEAVTPKRQQVPPEPVEAVGRRARGSKEDGLGVLERTEILQGMWITLVIRKITFGKKQEA